MNKNSMLVLDMGLNLIFKIIEMIQKSRSSPEDASKVLIKMGRLQSLVDQDAEDIANL